MTTLLGLTPFQSEALIVCLAASVIWAGALLAGAMHLERHGTARGDRLWIGALLLAILPSIVAPSLAAFGVSLRQVPVENVAAIAAAPIPDVRPMSSAVEIPHAAAPSNLPWTTEQAVHALALLYIYGAALAFFIWTARQTGFLIAASLADPVRNEKLLQEAEDWAFEFGVKTPTMKRSRHVSSVCIYGAVSPVILLPHDLDARVDESDIALMCAHEIAHLKRGDTRLFTATALARVLFWFNPLVTRIAANVELAAEEGADRLVLGSGIDRRAYASCFVKGLKFSAMKQSLLPSMAPSFTPNDRQGRRRRLDSILSTNAERRMPASSRAALVGAASIAVLLAVGQAAFAVDPEAGVERKRLAALASAYPIKPVAPMTAEVPVLAKPADGEVSLGFARTFTSLEDNKTPIDHRGIDIKATRGAPVKSTADGVVVEASTRVHGMESFGTMVIVDHGHGLLSRYAHLDSYKVKVGQKVKKGDLIGAVGETGRVTGPHLHFEVLKNGSPVDPSVAMAPDAPEPPQWTDVKITPNRVDPVDLVEPLEPAAPISGDFGDRDIRFFFSGADSFAFANGDNLADRMAGDLEQRLLGDIDAAADAKYDIEFTMNGKTRRFTSDSPMTPEKRSALIAAIEDMKVHRDAARKELDRVRVQWRKQAENTRLTVEKQRIKMQRDFEQAFAADRQAFLFDDANAKTAIAEFEQSNREIEEARREALEAANVARLEARREALDAEREALESEREAIEEAHADLDDSINESLDEALDDLDRDSRALEAESDVTENERRISRAALEQARREIERARADHQRQIERARAELDRRAAMIDRKLDALARSSASN